MSLYSLTHLTGRKRNADRKIIIATVETNKHGFIIACFSIVASLVPTALGVGIFGPVAMLVTPAAFVTGGLVLFKMRSEKGLQLPMYRMLLDKKAAQSVRGQILVCGVPIQKHSFLGQIVQSSGTVRSPVEDTDLFSDTAEEKALASKPGLGTSSAPADPRVIVSRSDIWD